MLELTEEISLQKKLSTTSWLKLMFLIVNAFSSLEVSQEDSLPSSFKSFVSLIFNAPSLKDHGKCESQACFTVSQAIFYNMHKNLLILLLTQNMLWVMNHLSPNSIHDQRQKTYSTTISDWCLHLWYIHQTYNISHVKREQK